MYVLATIENLSFKSTETVDTISRLGKLTMVLGSNPKVSFTIEPKREHMSTLLFTFEGGQYLNLHPDIFCHRIEIVDTFVKLVDDTFGWKGVPTYQMQGRNYSPLGVFKDVFVDGDQLLLDWGLDTRKTKPVKPMLTLQETVKINHARGHVLGGESNHRETFYTSWSGKTQKDNVTLSVYRKAYFTVCEPKIEFYQPVRVWGLVFKDLPFIEDDTLFTKEMFNSYSMQKVTFRNKDTHMTAISSFEAYVFKANNATEFSAEDGLCLYKIDVPEWVMLPVNSDGNLTYTSLYALSYEVELSKGALDKLGCVLARELWAESGKEISDMVVYPETMIYYADVPVKSDYEHKFVTPTSNESQSLTNLTGGVSPVMYLGRVGTVVDRRKNAYVSVRFFNYATNHVGYVSTSRLNNVMDMPRDARLGLMEKHPSGIYMYEGVDYDELYIRFPESLWAHLFSSSYGVPAFTAMYSNVYDRLPDNLRSLETANCIEEVCKFFYISGTVDSWKIA